jgi:hypothetical protein
MAPEKGDDRDLRSEWAPVVGRLILSFGDIENVTYLALLQLPKDKIFATTSSLPFGKRVDLVLDLVDGHPEIAEDLSKRFAEKLRDAKKLSETRNMVAHSPLVMQIFQHPKEGWVHREMALANAKNKEKALSLDALTQAASEADRLARELYDLYGSIHKRVVK